MAVCEPRGCPRATVPPQTRRAQQAIQLRARPFCRRRKDATPRPAQPRFDTDRPAAWRRAAGKWPKPRPGCRGGRPASRGRHPAHAPTSYRPCSGVCHPRMGRGRSTGSTTYNRARTGRLAHRPSGRLPIAPGPCSRACQRPDPPRSGQLPCRRLRPAGPDPGRAA